MIEIGKGIGLTDRFNVEITNGCKIQLLTRMGNCSKGDEFVCVFNVPQHRFGFSRENHPYFSNPMNYPDCYFYATPNNAKKLRVICNS